MATGIPDEKIAEIRDRADIVEIVGETVQLKKAGKNHLGLCPFHAEKTPSFTVSPDKQMYYCFGCGEGGNVIGFLMKQAGMTFPEALRYLARRYGIDLPTTPLTAEQKRQMRGREQLFEVNRLAADYYRQRLRQSPDGQKAQDYLHRRGFTGATIDAFELGYAPGGWENLKRHLNSRRISDNTSSKAGLITARKSSHGYYDRFRERIIFPILDLSRRIVAFGGRVLDTGEPKYLNSPETKIYNKRRILYGLGQARSACRRTGEIYVVEGYLDLLALHQHGIANAAATLGTALTAEQVRLLKGFVERVFLVFDADAAGNKAALRSSGLFLNAGLEARVMTLPEGHDPDSFVFEHGADAFGQLGRQALSMVSYLMTHAIQTHGRSIEGKVKSLNEITAVIAKIGDPVARTLYVRELSERLGIDEAAVQAKLRSQPSRAHANRAPLADARPPDGPAAGTTETAPLQAKSYKLEREIVAMLLQFPMIRDVVKRRRLIDLIENQDFKDIMRLIEDADPQDDLLLKTADSRLQRKIAQLSLKDHVWDREGCLRLIDQYEGLQLRLQDNLTAEIRAAEAAGDTERINRLMKIKQQQVLKKTPRQSHSLGGEPIWQKMRPRSVPDPKAPPRKTHQKRVSPKKY